MSTQETKKAKRRKNKVATGKYSATIPQQTNEVAEVVTEENGDAERIARLMDAPDEMDSLPAFNRGPNPFLEKEKCLLCGVHRTEAMPSGSESSAAESTDKSDVDGQSFAQLQVWVCQSCRNSTDINRSFDLKSVADIPMPAIGLNPPVQDIALDTSLGMMGEFNVFQSTGEPTLANGSMCTCDSCMERRQITQEYEQETKALQTVWTNLRTKVRRLYSMELTSLSEEEAMTFRNLVDKLCSRDPHQLFQRLESQVREFVIEKKMNLRKKINAGYSTPPQAREIMSMLLEEYNNLSDIARIVSENLSTLKDHLRRFNVTWELHNKHLYHSIVYTEPAIQGCLETLCEQLRNGALDKESFTEDTYPNLMKNFVSFRNEMSVILVLWHDCQQLIDRFNEQQTALKVKQKWLKEDWEFFKAQRKILEQQVLKNNPKASMPPSMEAQFTETMRNMLSGQKPPAEESHCPRCSRKRCPCDECTITHMITCGIINPEQLENNGSHHIFNFPHDTSRYIIDVTPPSMSSTTSSSASSSPVPITRDMATHLNSCNQSSQGDIQETEKNISRMDEDDKEDEADNEDNDDDDDDEDNEEDDEDDDEGEDEDEEEGDADEEEEEEDEDEVGISEDQKEFDAMLASGKLGRTSAPVVVPSANPKLWGAMCPQQNQQPEETLEPSTQDYPAMGSPCACHHCVTPAQTEPRVEVGPEETQCQCHICLQQRGQTVSTALPTSVTLPPRPAGLHLYPHIHGTLHASTHQQLHIAHSHTGHPMVNHMTHSPDHSLLQPQLYNLHGARLPFKLDIEDTDSIHDHLLSAYGDWDNSSYDSVRMMGPPPHRFSTNLSQDLLPPPPMTADAPFSLEALSPSVASASHAVAASHLMIGSSSMATTTSSAFKAVATAGFATGIPPAFQIPTESFETLPTSTASTQSQHTSSVPELNLNLRSTPLSSLPISFSSAAPSTISSLPLPHNPPPSTRPVTLGGNVGAAPTLGKEQRTYAQPCKKYSLSQNSGFGASGKVGVTSPPPPPASHNHMNVSLANGVQATNGKTASKSRQLAPSSQPSHSCTHSQHMMHNNGGEGQTDLQHSAIGTCSSASVLPTTINNVSVGTSTLCTDPDCQSHHDDNCDSIDDSCSEKSSSTSTSNNQKEGKYCDCCYCEFFGHGNPPVAQTSKNFNEMRERLRRRLKQRNEAKQDGGNSEDQSSIQHNTLSMNLDELLKFINGTDSEGGRNNSQQSSRAAKRARQKERKAAERLRQEEEEKRQQLLTQRLLEADKKNSVSNTSGQKKKGKHKEERQQTGTSGGRLEGPGGQEITGGNQTKAVSRGKQRLKDGQLDQQVEKIGGSTQESSAPNRKFTVAKQEVVNVTSPLMHVRKANPTSPLVNGKDVKKLAEVFQPPSHLMSRLVEQVASSKASSPSLMSSPTSLPTLGGQPNSPTAKKAKRRLTPGTAQQGQLSAQRKLLLQSPTDLQQVELQRRNEAKQEVAKQMKEAEELSHQQTQLRQQMQIQQMMQQKLKDEHLQQEKLQQQKSAQQKKIQQQQAQLKQTLQVQQHQGKIQQPKQESQTPSEVSPRQPGPGKQNAVSSQLASNGVAAQHMTTNNTKLANGIAVAPRTSSSCGTPSPAIGTGLASTKHLSTGTNGLMNQARIANMAQKTSTAHSEQTEQARNSKGKAKKKKKANQDIRAVDEVFMPRPEEELESNDMDEADRDIEKFKRFVMENPTPPKERQKLDINLNMKDIFSKKKSGMGCT